MKLCQIESTINYKNNLESVRNWHAIIRISCGLICWTGASYCWIRSLALPVWDYWRRAKRLFHVHRGVHGLYGNGAGSMAGFSIHLNIDYILERQV